MTTGQENIREKDNIELSFLTRHKSGEESITLSSNSLLFIDLLQLTTDEQDSSRCGHMRLWTLKPLL